METRESQRDYRADSRAMIATLSRQSLDVNRTTTSFRVIGGCFFVVYGIWNRMRRRFHLMSLDSSSKKPRQISRRSTRFSLIHIPNCISLRTNSSAPIARNLIFSDSRARFRFLTSHPSPIVFRFVTFYLADTLSRVCLYLCPRRWCAYRCTRFAWQARSADAACLFTYARRCDARRKGFSFLFRLRHVEHHGDHCKAMCALLHSDIWRRQNFDGLRD